MTTGLERVARALCELEIKPPDATMDGKPLWQDHLPEAWATIMAPREPDQAMISAAALKTAESEKDHIATMDRATIDAAVSGQPHKCEAPNPILQMADFGQSALDGAIDKWPYAMDGTTSRSNMTSGRGSLTFLKIDDEAISPAARSHLRWAHRGHARAGDREGASRA